MRRALIVCALGGIRVRGLGLAACALALLAATPAPAHSQSSAVPERFDRVVIDAGHGGDDEGAKGADGLVEKELVLDLAQRLAAKLREQGLTVDLTRNEDAFVPLDERTRVANAAHADLFVSIHANASRLAKVRGAETFFASLEASDEAAEELARAENAAFGPAAAKLSAGDPVLAILGDLMAQQQLADSQEFARIAQREIAGAAGARSRGVKQAPFVVLMGVRMPAVLVEVGFVSNPSDEKALQKKGERERIASSLARAIRTFGALQDERSGVARGKAAKRPRSEAQPSEAQTREPAKRPRSEAQPSEAQTREPAKQPRCEAQPSGARTGGQR